MANCRVSMFTGVGDSIAINGLVKSCEDSPISEMQMEVVSVANDVSGPQTI